MKNFTRSTHRFSSFSILSSPHEGKITRILQAALHAVEPGEAVRRHLHRTASRLTVADREYDLSQFQRIRMVGVGKAAVPMALATYEIIGPHFHSGLVLTKEGHLGHHVDLPDIAWFEAGHPIPDQRSVDGAQRLVDFVSDHEPDDLMIILISGGGSALMTHPAPGISLENLQELTSSLLAVGADIQQINTLRKHLDTVKGGGLARLAAPAEIITLILSDVVGDPLDVIASGPTVPDPTTFEDAFEVLQGCQLSGNVAPPIIARLQQGRRGEIPETPKPGSDIFRNVHNILIGSNVQAAQSALEQAQAEGFHALLLTTYLQGEARQAGRMLGSLLKQVASSGQPIPRPACLIAGGETTVTLKHGEIGDPDHHLGGRNQELALGAVAELAGLQDVMLVALATDGGDGPTDAAGAVTTGATLARAQMLGLAPPEFLARNDSYHFFEPLDDLIITGPTQTNVNDLTFLFAL